VLDYYHTQNYIPEIWASQRYNFHPAIDYDIHDPYTDKYLKSMVANVKGTGGLAGSHPSGKDG
jgi:hypothetical protein